MQANVRVNFILSEHLYNAFKNLIPKRQRSQVVNLLIQQEIQRRENKLYEIAKSIEEDVVLKEEMDEWGIASQDGLDKV